MTQERKHGPFTWVRREGSESEVWVLQQPRDMGLTYFVLKDYGGTPGPGFAGWKLVSGGPFDEPGAYDSLDAALVGVTPWLVARYEEELADKLEEYTAFLQHMNDMRARFGEQ